MKLLMHTCCAPCSVYCIDSLREEGIEPVSYWFNPNIHPYIEYKTRRDTLKEYSKMANFELIINENYGLDEFCKNVVNDLNNRCVNYCYPVRIEQTAKFAKENGYDAFTTTLFVSPYQKHDEIKKVCEFMAEKYKIEFLYRDFRPGFREGQAKARELGLYMQKYCGCVFSEEERYGKQIERDKSKGSFMENTIKLVKPGLEHKEQVLNLKKQFLENNQEFDGCAGLETCETYEEWIDFENRLKKQFGDEYSKSDTFIAIRESDNKLIGIIDCRYDLTDFLLNFGGNIGYCIAIDERRKGYGKEMLKLALEKYREKGFSKVLVTCDKENIASAKVTMANGGVLENEVVDTVGLSKSGTIQRRWITL